MNKYLDVCDNCEAVGYPGTTSEIDEQGLCFECAAGLGGDTYYDDL